MKHIILLAIMCMAIVSPGLQELAAQQSSPGWFIVFEEKFASTSRTQIMKAQKKAVDMLKIYHPDVPVFAWQNDDNSLYRVIPIFSFASIDTLYRKLEQVSRGLKVTAYSSDENSGNQSTVSGTVMVRVPGLSHRTSMEFLLSPDKPYTEWMFYYLLSGHEEQAEEALRNFRDYYIENKLDYPWDTFRVLLGSATPMMISLFRAESPAVLQAKGNKVWKKHSYELEKLWGEVERHTWKIENKTGWFNQSLSNIPDVAPIEEVAGGASLSW